ncbi:MAG: hypothetical protein KAS19_07250, partial [Anaerolineales bacterium]|nr:hypothetical protein [Anaerolineales bacterium]
YASNGERIRLRNVSAGASRVMTCPVSQLAVYYQPRFTSHNGDYQSVVSLLCPSVLCNYQQ